MIGSPRWGSHVACLFSLYLRSNQCDSEQRRFIFLYRNRLISIISWVNVTDLKLRLFCSWPCIYKLYNLRILQLIRMIYHLRDQINYIYTNFFVYSLIDIRRCFFFMLPYINIVMHILHVVWTEEFGHIKTKKKYEEFW